MLELAILDDYQRVALSLADWDRLRDRVRITVFDQALGADAAARLAPFDIVCMMRERTPFPRALFEALPKLKFMTLTGARSPSLDLDAASEHGVVVSHTGYGSQQSTAELAWSLILASARHLPTETAGMRAGGWQTTVGRVVDRKVLGLLGLGKLGSRMAAIGRAFGMEVQAWSQNLTAEKAEAAGARLVDKETLFRTSDWISIHLVLSDRSRALVAAPELALMKPDAWIVNTSRGPIIDEAALLATLDAGTIGGAALDVYAQEPLPADHPLRRAPRTILTPHLGFVTEDAYQVFYRDTVEDVAAWLDGAPVRVMNPAALDRRP
ncbi:MAG TPA: D-2-hydroxyacid dehydrogenase family protein [Aliidongia sp.]|uniref:D-2-hydroxyacid dehydrogenase family protein n=1 Tax=Aliidongia sp. TaxID=1914230 RepID=UPI002DDCD871|nr:D-2-hydroxyacid dehydrogenase family protein [Aliidongia sp.]HEV2673500.1 D-2-hydroxyacid dehydrogenase family protein [Aliidongia sp.]